MRKLLLVEDEPMVAGLLSESLMSADFEVRVAHSAIEASELAAKFDPDIAVIDINLGLGASGVELAFILDKKIPGIALMLLTKHPDLRTAGFSQSDVPDGCGFIRKDLITDTESMVEAIESVIGSRQKQPRQDGDPERPLGQLTRTQVEVLRLIAMGYTNAKVAEERGTSLRAVELVLEEIYRLLEISDDSDINPRVEAVRQFITAAGTPNRK